MQQETLPGVAHKLIMLEQGEHIVLEARKHMLVFYARLVFLVGLFFLPLIFSPFIIKMLNALSEPNSGSLIFGFLFALWLLALLIVFVYRWTDYYLDVWIITNKRLFDIEQKGFFTRTISSCRIEKIQDVSIEVAGILATFFKFGTVHIHTAGEKHDFSIRDAANPAHIKNTLMHTMGKTIDSTDSNAIFGGDSV